MDRSLAESLRPSAAELRDEAWQLLNERSNASSRRTRRQLAERAFELALLAGRLETEAGQRREDRAATEK
jgi:hypothetical protein